MAKSILPGPERFLRLDEGSGGRVGQGSFGQIYMAVDQVTQQLVAVKRQSLPKEQAARELATFRLLLMYPHEHVVKMHDHFVTPFQGSTSRGYLYLVFEFMENNLWDLLKTPRGRRGLLDRSLAARYILHTCLGVNHLHELGIVHKDLSLSNLLLSSSHVVKVADMGTAMSARSILAPTDHPVTTLYVQAPEIMLRDGSPGQQCAETVDCWSVGVVAMALWTGELPFIFWPKNVESADAEGWTFAAQLRLLGPITEESWPGHDALPRWSELSRRAADQKNAVALALDIGEASSNSSLRMRLSARPACRPIEDPNDPGLELVAGLLLWCPARRFTMQAALRQPFLQRAAEGGAAGSLAVSSRPICEREHAGEVLSDAPHTRSPRVSLCSCSGNCGRKGCRIHQNQRRANQETTTICSLEPAEGQTLCSKCQCEVDGCRQPRNKTFAQRWCSTHADFKNIPCQTQYVNKYGIHKYDKSWPLSVQMVARMAFVLDRITPTDGVAWMSFCSQVCKPQVGAPISAMQFAWCFIAHALKWPPAVDQLRNLIQESAAELPPSARIIAAVRQVILWAHGKPLKKMHAEMSSVGRMDAQTGLVICGKNLGLLTALRDFREESMENAAVRQRTPARNEAGYGERLSLGVNGRTYILAPESAGGVAEKIAQKVLDIAGEAALIWPATSADVPDFADKVLATNRKIRSARVDGYGFEGGSGEHDDLLKHGTRPWLLIVEASRMLPQAFDDLPLSEILKWTPDELDNLGVLSSWRGSEICHRFGMSALWMSCWTCFLGKVSDTDAQVLRMADDAELWAPVLAWELQRETNPDQEDTFPPMPATIAASLRGSSSSDPRKRTTGLQTRKRPAGRIEK